MTSLRFLIYLDEYPFIREPALSCIKPRGAGKLDLRQNAFRRLD